MTSPPSDAAEASSCASSPTTSEQRLTPTDDPEPLSFPDDEENYGLHTNRTWVDTHGSLLHTDRGLYISVRGIKDADNPDGKRSRPDSVHTTHSKVARTDLLVDAATASHNAIAQYESQDEPGDAFSAPIGDVTSIPLLSEATALNMDDEEEPGDEIPEGTTMDDRKPDISLIDIPHSDKVVSSEYLWRQCAVFMEMKKRAGDGPLGTDTANALQADGEPVTSTRAMLVSKRIITQMADNARILMATRPFLRFCLHITFCGTNFNMVPFDRNGIIISRSYLFETHLKLFIRIIRRLSREMTAYDLGLDTTVRPEGCLGSVNYPSYLVKISDKTWYRTEGVPLWQSTSLLGRGTLVFNARGYSEPGGPPRILKNAWREDGRLKESELYELMQNSQSPFESPKALAKFIVGGDVPLHDGRMVTIQGHRAHFDSTVIGNGATVHRLILASRGKSLANYAKYKHLLKAALGIVIGMKSSFELVGSLPDTPLAHKLLHEQGILHGDISYGNTFLSESAEDHIYGFLADLDLASIGDEALDKLPEGTANVLKGQRAKGPRSVGYSTPSSSQLLMIAFQGTVIFMAIELLESQVEHFEGEEAARKRARPGPPTLSLERKAYHDLEALIWVLVYAMMIHNYNSLANETDRKGYKKILDDYFGHGSAQMILDRRHAMLSSAHSHVSWNRVAKWFPNPDERNFFTACMSLISEHIKEEDKVAKWTKLFEGEINDNNPALWGRFNDKTYENPDEDADDKSGTYMPSKATKSLQTPVARARSRKRPPVITYQSVVSLLANSIDEI